MPTDSTNARLDEHHERISNLEGRVSNVEQTVGDMRAEFSDVRADMKILGANMATNTLMTAEVAKDTKNLVTMSKVANVFYKLILAVAGLAGAIVAVREAVKLFV